MEVIVPEVVKAPHSAREHDKISPSKLNYLDPEVGGCVGFKNTDTTNEAAEEGTRNHETMEVELEVVRTKLTPITSNTCFSSHIWARRIGAKWPDETYELLHFCAHHLDPYLQGLDRNSILQESRRTLTGLDDKPLMFGHDDVTLLRRKQNMVIVADYKFGWEPVISAAVNRQTMAYGIMALQAFPWAKSVGVMLIQPKHNAVTKRVIKREEIQPLLELIHRIVENHRLALRDLTKAQLNPGVACRYCARAGTCPAYLERLPVAVRATGGLPSLADINVQAIQTPEQAAVAAAWVDFLNDEALKNIKKRALEIAQLNGRVISHTLPDGTEIRYEVEDKKFDRVVGAAPLVAEALQDIVDPKVVLGAASLSIGKLVDIVAPIIQENAALMGNEITKKAATEQLEGLLEANNLLSRPDGTIPYLKRKVVKEPKVKTPKSKKPKAVEQAIS